MKSLLACTGLLIAAATLAAQTPAPKPPPASPAATESATIAGKSITITYNSPGVKGRAGQIFTKDGLISHNPHYPVWRAGANSATLLHTDADLTIGDLSVPKGNYTLFVDISDPDNWVLIVNKQTGQWGLAYDGTKDLGRTKMTMTKPAETIENLKYTLAGTGGSAGTLTLAWESHIASVPFTVK
jgi:hypothetical protein